MGNKLPRARETVTRLIKSSLQAPVVSDWLAKHRRLDLPDFLSAVVSTTPQAVLADPAGVRDAHHHLVAQWPATVQQIARPETLPAVRQRRERVRVHPMAPLSTAAISAAGAVTVTQGSLAMPLEIGGVAAAVALSAWGTSSLWKPRARPKDRNFTLFGTPALLARGQTELADHPLAALTAGSTAPSEADEQLTQLVAAGRQLEDLEREACGAGLIDERGALRTQPRTPAEQGLMSELLARRLDLVRAVVGLGTAGWTERARQRDEERASYGMGDGAGPDNEDGPNSPKS